MAGKYTAGRLRRDPDLAFRVLEGEAVLVDPRNREVHVLNETGTLIWQMLAEPHVFKDVVAKLSEEFDGEPLEIEKDVVSFLDSLVGKGLVSSDA